MIKDFLDPRNSEGMPDQANAFFALQFLLMVKSGVRNSAIAITEAVTPEVRTQFRSQLRQGLAMHAELSQLMMEKGWLHAYDSPQQFKLDMNAARTIVQIAKMELFPEDTSRLGTFATPDY